MVPFDALFRTSICRSPENRRQVSSAQVIFAAIVLPRYRDSTKTPPRRLGIVDDEEVCDTRIEDCRGSHEENFELRFRDYSARVHEWNGATGRET